MNKSILMICKIITIMPKQINKMNTNNTTFYFYKGTCFPMHMQGDDGTETTETANEMIKNGLLMGLTLKSQIIIYKEQLDIIENCLIKHRQIFNKNQKKGKQLIEKQLEQDWDEIYHLWLLNICALLKLKAIPNDEQNGLLIMKSKV